MFVQVVCTSRAIRWFYRKFAQPHNSCVRHRDGAICRFYGGGSACSFRRAKKKKEQGGWVGMDSSADYLKFFKSFLTPSLFFLISF